jgi:hypothetical protein
MADAPKKMAVGSMIAAGLVGVLAICDLIIGFPFSGVTGKSLMMMTDILFVICAAIVGYLAYDAYKDLR